MAGTEKSHDRLLLLFGNVNGFNTKNKIYYPNLHSAISPVSHGSEMPVPQTPFNLDDRGISQRTRHISFPGRI